jgi:hypothetical protein
MPTLKRSIIIFSTFFSVKRRVTTVRLIVRNFLTGLDIVDIMNLRFTQKKGDFLNS